MDIASFSADSRAVLKVAKEVAQTFRHPEIDVEHLLMATVRHEGSEVESILNQLGKSVAFVESAIEEFLKEQTAKGRDNPTTSPATQQVLQQAMEEKSRLYDPLVEPEHILIAIFDPKSKLSPYLRDKLDMTKEAMYNAMADSKAVEEIASSSGDKAAAGQPGESKREISGTLRYCIDMTNQAAAGEFDPMIGREMELQQTMQVLLRRRKNSPVLVGGAGVGKSAIVEGLAQAVIDGRVPKVLDGVKIMSLDMGSLVAGAKYKGEFEERFKTLVGDVVKSGGRIILFIDELHTISGAGGGGGMDAANLLKPALARGQIRLVGATTVEEYTKHIEKDKALDRRFEKVKVEQPNHDESVRIIQGVVGKYAEHHKLTYTENAIDGSVRYSRRYLAERNLPDIALDLIDEAGSEFSVKEEFCKVKIPNLEKQIGEIEKLVKAAAGKDPEKDPEVKELRKAYDSFLREFEQVDGYWGHRADALEETKS